MASSDGTLSNFMGLTVLPVYGGLQSFRMTQPLYQVNGIALLTQPHVATAPTHSQPIIPLGSTFTLLFSQADGATATALTNGSKVTMQFALAHGKTVSGQVQLATSVNSGMTQVTVTLLASIAVPTN